MEKAEDEFKDYKFIDSKVDRTTRVMSALHIPSNTTDRRMYTISEMNTLYESGIDWEHEIKSSLKADIERAIKKKTQKA